MSLEDLEITFDKARKAEEYELLQGTISEFFGSDIKGIVYYRGKEESPLGEPIKAVVFSDELDYPDRFGISRADLDVSAMGEKSARYIMQPRAAARIEDVDVKRAETVEVFVRTPAAFVDDLLNPDSQILRGRDITEGMRMQDVAKLILKTAKGLKGLPRIFNKRISELSPDESQYFSQGTLDYLESSRDETVLEIILSKHEDLRKYFPQ